jgi:DNA-binding NarL/FixJ family response regulator
LRALLEPEFDVIGTASNGRALLRAASKLQPDVILIDISLPLLNGIDASQRLRELVPRSLLIIVTMHADQTYAAAAFAAGASAYVAKQAGGAELARAIRAVLGGRTHLTVGLAAEPTDDAVAPTGSLTGRQREVLQLVAEGHSVKEIARLLNISRKTVEFHKTHIMDRLGVRTTAELTRYAIAHRLIAAP